MNAARPIPILDPDADPDAAERRGRQAAQLQDLAGIGLELARDIGRLGRSLAQAAEAAEAAGGTGETDRSAAAAALALAFSRVARAVRLTMALETRLAEGPRLPAGRAAPEPAADDGGDPVAARLAAMSRAEGEAFARRAGAKARRMALADGVIRVIDAGLDPDAEEDEERCEAMVRAFTERLDEVEEDELFDRPMGELVAMVCKDLGVAFDAELWADEEWMEPIRVILRAQRAERAAAAQAPPAHHPPRPATRPP